MKRFKREDGTDFPDWQEAEFEDVLRVVPSKKFGIVSKEFLSVGDFPIVTQSRSELISGYTNDPTKILPQEGPSHILFGDHSCALKFLDFSCALGGDGIKLLKVASEDLFNPKFIYYLLKSKNVRNSGYKRHFYKWEKRVLSIPCLEEQNKIADFLTELDKRIGLEKQLVEQLVEQHKGIAQELMEVIL